MKLRYLFLGFILIVLFVTGCFKNENSSDWPQDGNVFTLMVGYEMGGQADSIARFFATSLEKQLTIPVAIKNVPGSWNLASINETFSKSNDEYTILYGSTIDGIGPHYYLSHTDIPWVLDDWRTLGIYGQFPDMGLAVNSDAPWDHFSDFIRDARKQTGEITVGSLGPGRLDDILIIELQEFFDVEFNWSFYDSPRNLESDLINGTIDAGLFQTQRENVVNHPELTILTAIGSNLPEDYPFDVPTLKDFELELDFQVDDLKALQLGTSYTFFVKAETPEPVFQELAALVKTIATDQEWQSAMPLNTGPTYIPPEEAEEIFHHINEIIREYEPLHKEYMSRNY